MRNAVSATIDRLYLYSPPHKLHRVFMFFQYFHLGLELPKSLTKLADLMKFRTDYA